MLLDFWGQVQKRSDSFHRFFQDAWSGGICLSCKMSKYPETPIWEIATAELLGTSSLECQPCESRLGRPVQLSLQMTVAWADVWLNCISENCSSEDFLNFWSIKSLAKSNGSFRPWSFEGICYAATDDWNTGLTFTLFIYFSLFH